MARDNAVDQQTGMLFFLLGRTGHRESRRVLQVVWNIGQGQGKRADGASHKPTLAQRRGYGDDVLKWPGQHVLRDDDDARDAGSKSTWGLSWDNNTGRDRREHVGHPEGEGDEGDEGDAFLPQNRTRDDLLGIESQLDLWERFESETAQGPYTPAQKQTEADEEAPEPAILTNSLLNVDYKNELQPALDKRASDLVIRCLYAAAQVHDQDFLASISAPMFSQILELLEPNQFVAKLGTAHIELSTALAASMNIAPMREVAFEYNKTLLRILKDRRSTGHIPTLDDYVLLLRSARLLGSHKMAGIVWRSLLKDGIQPDTRCFNHYMASLVWNGMHSAGSRHKVRAIPFFMMARSAAHRDRRFSNYRVGDCGVKEETMKAFGEMLAFGAVADHESFQILITACARDGDIATVKAILQRVWGIDVQSIMEGKDEATIAPKSFSDDSPIRPQSSLLFALAHAFGINNDVPSALRVVDFVARHYELEITSEIWNQLFEWTFVLAHQRRPDAPENAGKLPIGSVLGLWETMTGPPYFIKPTLGMYSRLISNLVDRKYTSKIIEVMREAMPLHRADADAAHKARRRLAAAVQEGKPVDDIEMSRKEWEYTRMIHARNVFWLRRWVRQILTSLNIRNVFDGGKAKFLDELPRVLWEWRRYAPRKVQYEIASGFVDLEFHEERDSSRRWSADRLHPLKEKSRRYVGNDWAVEHKMSDRNLEEREQRRCSKAAAREEQNFRRLVGGHLAKEFGSAL